MNVRRRGFTLIEILITIGIIMVLIAIVSVGITYVARASKTASAKGMACEFPKLSAKEIV